MIVATKLATSIRAATQPQLRDYQQDGYDAIHASWSAGNKNVVAVFPTGAGKCLGKDTPVLMFDGSIKMVQDVVPGDLLMGPDSQPRGVLTTCTGREMLYRITPVKGDPYIVNESHILSLRKRGKIVNIEVRNYLKLSTSQRKLHYGWKVPLVTEGNNHWVKSYIKHVLPIGEGDYYGFEITGDRLFMLGDFTVTHNTVLLSRIVFDHDGASCVIAHRQELVSQISIALARNGVRHRIIGPDNVIRNIVQLHMNELGLSFYDPNARCAVAGVDTLVRRMGTGKDGDEYYYKDNSGDLWYYEPRKNGYWMDPTRINELPMGERAQRTKPSNIDPRIAKWSPTVTLWVTDECHHVLADNKWGKACSLFSRAKGLGVTATPERSDGAGLGRHADGVFDDMIIGPTMRELINRGYLTDYDIVVPPNNIALSDKDISKTTGDYKQSAIVDAVEHSSLVGEDDGKRRVIGDIVTCYEKFATGKLGVTFVPSIKIGERVKQQFLDEGIPAELVTADTPDLERARILRDFKNRKIMNLINVDLFGEGFDLPAIEVVSMARPTQSYGLYVQQFGRALRLLEGKTKALIIDHVGNVLGARGHGLPDAARTWTLDRRERRASSGASDVIPLRRCLNVECFKAYERYMTACPHCGEPVPQPLGRTEPEFVDGDLYMLDPETLAKMRGEVTTVDMTSQQLAEQYHRELQARKCPQQYIMKHVRTKIAEHEARQGGQSIMREAFSVWAGWRRAEGLSDREIYRKFYVVFGVDYLTAMTYDETKALDLTSRMMDTLTC